MAWFDDFAETLTRDRPLGPLTTLGIGGSARWFFEPRTVRELARLRAALSANDVPVRFLGNGSNLLVSDEGVRGAVVSFRRLNFIEPVGDVDLRAPRDDDPVELDVGAGVLIPHLTTKVTRWGLTGLERCVGIPGSIGGSLHQNAGGREGTLGDLVEHAAIVAPDGAVSIRTLPELGLGYRKSALRGGAVGSVRLRLERAASADVSARVKSIMSYRKATQPLQERSPGCIFVNPGGEYSASWLLDRAGVKGLRRGQASFSEKHANFIINHGGATARDVRDLIDEGRDRVLDRFGERLALEIIRWDDRQPSPSLATT